MRKAIERKILVEVIWTHFIPQIKSGAPVYFSFHKDMLRRILASYELDVDDPLAEVSMAIRDLVAISGTSVFVREEAFAPIFKHFSSVILFVCQQILVVEEMCKEKNGHGEDAYFPRLRRALSSMIPEHRLNPFGTQDEFETIWEQFKSEIMEAGGKNGTVTFSRGLGKNLARAYPLSQALLNREDVYTLIRRIGPRRIFKIDNVELSRELRRERERISRRGQGILAIPFMREHVYRQIRSYVNSPVPEAEASQTSLETSASEIRIFKDRLDWFTEEFRVGAFDSITGARNGTTEFVVAAIQTILNRRKYLVFVRGGVGEYWRKAREAVEIVRGESFLILANAYDQESVERTFSSFFPSFRSESSTHQITDVPDVVLYHFVLADHVASVFVKDGQILDIPIRSGPAFEWIGGICVDERSRKYLRGFLPTHYKIAGKTTSCSGSIIINSRQTTFEHFFSSIGLLDGDENYSVDIGDGVKTTLGIGIKRRDDETKVGIQIYPNGNLGPSPSIQSPGDSCLQGFAVDFEGRPLALTLSCVDHLISGEGTWVKIESEMASKVVDAVGALEISALLKKIVMDQVVTRLAAPAQVLVELGLSQIDK